MEFLKAGITKLREGTTHVHGHADYVFDEGTYVLTYENGVTERGKYMSVLKQEG